MRRYWSLLCVAGLVLAGCGGDASDDDALPADTSGASDIEGERSDATTPVVADTAAPTAVTTPEPEPERGTPVTSAAPSGGLSIRTFTDADGLPGSRIGSVDVGLDGTVWVAVETAEVDPGGGLWYETYAGFDGSEWLDIGTPDLVELDGPDETHAPFVYGMDISGGPNGTLWVITTGFDSTGDAYRFDGDGWTSPEYDPPGPWFLTGAAASDGPLWTIGLGPDLEASDAIGLYRLEGDTLTRQPSPPGGIECVFCVQYDVGTDGTLWMSNGSISGFDGTEWSVIDAAYPEFESTGFAPGEGRWSLGADGSHWLLAATDSAGTPWSATRVGNAGVEQVAASPDDVEFDDVCLAEHYDVEPEWIADVLAKRDLALLVAGFTGDAHGRLWIAVDCVGVFGIDPDGAPTIELGLTDGIPSLEFAGIAAHPDGSVWVATDAGVVRIAVT